MKKAVIFLCFLCFLEFISRCDGLIIGGNHVLTTYYYVRTSYKTSCGTFGWSRCRRYRSVITHRNTCYPGWTYIFFTEQHCNHAICNGKIDYGSFKACNKYITYDYQYKRDVGIVRNSGGECHNPDACTNCVSGFYSTGPYCEICGKIDHCNYRTCTTGSNQICQWCDGEIVYKQYWRAYTRHLDLTKCQKACSWRSDSSRCYPGTCTNELASQCNCATNFGGTHCENILDTPLLLENYCKFSDNGGHNIAENDGNYVLDDKPIIWTNFPSFTTIYAKMSAKYTQPADTRTSEHYVRDFAVGVIEERVTLYYYKAGVYKSQKVKTCTQSGMSQDQPDLDGEECTFDFNSWSGFGHDDKVIFEASTTNGGYVKTADRDRSHDDSVLYTYYYNGQTKKRQFEFHWDLVSPYHCSVSSGTSCTPFVTMTTDITDNPSITFTWDGWTDDLSQLSHYHYKVYELTEDGTSLKDGMSSIKEVNNIPLSDSSASFDLTEPGMYSIHFSAFDNANNHKTGRGLFLYDNVAEVTIQGETTKCLTASKDTSYEWVVQDTNQVEIAWPDRFINTRHKTFKWLNKVLTYEAGGITIYEDLYGDRTNVAIKNVHAIVDFQVSFEVHSDDSTLKDSRALTSIADIYTQNDILTLNWADGDRLQTTVKAFDVLQRTNEETITVYRDATPPIIQNLWLTIGDRLNVSVHSVKDFTKMTIEWEAFDIHSGLDSVYWKLYDTYGNTLVLHGHEDIVAQGHATDLTDCQDKYSSYARGANCYCTAFHGCYHKHFQVKPEIKAHGGLILNKDQGEHEYDYFIDISVTSKAKLTTVLTKKITIDISPPHPGVVNDGLQGNPEIDYQQDMNLNAYWDQFFDRESGVYFYQYIIDTKCAEKTDFNLNTSLTNAVETYNTYGSHTATTDGTYYFTVVAYNRALDPSDPVCSDGVTIDSSVPGVKEVVVKDSLITGGLITDSTMTNYYILGSDRVRRLITTPTADCVTKATRLADIDLYPLQKFDNGTLIEVDGSIFCSNSTGSPANIGLSLFKSSLMELSWIPIDIPAKVYDYEVGFSSTAGSAAPDLMAFQSTKQHAHHRVLHGNIPDATLFYIIIKSISKSNVEGLTTLGPCFMDTTPPVFSGSITVSLSGDLLVTEWDAGAFSDSEELFQLDYQFAIGHTAYGTDVQNFKPLKFGGSCTMVYPPVCTVVNITDLDWFLHGHHTYYVSIKVTNTAGLVKIETSSPYIHDVQKPSEGVVFDIDVEMFNTEIPLMDIEDVEFQKDTTSMAARWSGFAHPHLDVTYKYGIGTTKGGNDIVPMTDVGTTLYHKVTGLSLVPYQKYYFTVTAVTTAGSTTMSSDGVTIVTEDAVLPGVMVYDGRPCNMTDMSIDHHESDNRFYCNDDIDVQISTSSLETYWTVPDDIKPYTTNAWISIERRTAVGNLWSTIQDYVHLSTVFDVGLHNLVLNSGIMYRIVLKLCAKNICFQPITTDGVMVIAKPPTTGVIDVEHLNTTQTGGAEKLVVSFDRFYDPDIEDMTEKYDAVDKYEFTITDNSVQSKTYISWTNLDSYTTNGNKISFEYVLNGTMDFSRCKRFAIRGYNKVRQYSIISTDIKYCQAINPKLIEPNDVVDAVGEPDELDGQGKPIFHKGNDYWLKEDVDYTPYKNILSAVWRNFRHNNFKYAVIEVKSVDAASYYKPVNQLVLTDPWSHPDQIATGETGEKFVNVHFADGSVLGNGKKCMFCVHAETTIIYHHDWTENLPATSACSDGVIVDLTPPSAGRVWISNNPGNFYQSTTTDMYVNWDGFHDIEEYSTTPHSTGIKEYILGIGTTAGGNDVHAFENVGVVQHKVLHQLTLQNGYQYYATVKAVDFANRETIVVSEPVLVDTTPPIRSGNPITLNNRHITSTREINTCWEGVFSDLESGIDYYLWSIGSEPGYTDMMPYMKVVDEECGNTDKNNPLDLQDGHYYYINVRAFNKAGLSSLATSWAFRVVTTPPTAGHVYDGDRTLMTGNIKDVDYQTDTKVLKAYWVGFQESHSVIQDYYVYVGTCPRCDDVLPQQAVGIVYDFSISDIHLGVGLRYYVTVTVCNTAGMCTTVTSDGVIIDNSPPTPGSVQDGTGYLDTHYQSMRNYLSAKWYGFDDPQSGLEKYVWRVGTTQGGDNILSATQLHITQVAVLLNSTNFNLDLPIGQRIYITVRAYNKAGLWSEATSNGFVVDDTAPVIAKAPTFSADFGIMGLTQIYRTSMKIEWEVDDAESYIKRQFLSINSHIGGEFMLSSVPVNGIARSYVFTGLDLHDGVTYYVTLISCNSADICIFSTTPGMFVDSTPPSRGMFAITTDHAADPDLARHSEGWMRWSARAVYLAWLGFSDSHSQIDHYQVIAGSTYMAKDLTKDHTAKYIHMNTTTDHGDEGKVQLFTVDTEVLTKYDVLYITVWAVNKVGLRSHLIHSAFNKNPAGSLNLIRRCSSLSCAGHCICAPQDQMCSYAGSCNDVSSSSCNDVSSNKLIVSPRSNVFIFLAHAMMCPQLSRLSPLDQMCSYSGSCNGVSSSLSSSTQYSLLLVKDTNGYSTDDQAVTASDNVLRATWLISQVYPFKPQWYEWSVGYNAFTTPQGFYDPADDKVWQDAGQLTDAVFTISPGKDLLKNTLVYSVFVRVWYDYNTYAVFKTNGIFVMTQAPALATVRGAAVTEKVRGTNVKDDDYMQIGRPITFSWKNKFLEAAETIQKFRIYISSYPGGHDLLTIADVLPGTVTEFNMTGLKTPGIVHYSNVIGYNYAGAHTTASSDGFTIDHINPSKGIVYDGLGIVDQEYSNSSDTIAAHWHGFVDTESGILKYSWCVGETTHVHRFYEKTECNILSWTNVGLHTSASRNLSSDITQGTKIYNKIYATDGADRKSEIVVSDGVLIDKTAPVPEKFIHLDENIAKNPSFETTEGNEINFENVSLTDICAVSNSYYPLSWIPTTTTCLGVVSSDINLAKDGRSFLFIRGSVHQNLEQVTAGNLYRVSFYSSHLPITDSVAANKEGFVRLADDQHIFLIYTKTYRHDGHLATESREKISWHFHTFYFKANTDGANITIGSTDVTTGIFIDNLSIQEVNLTQGEASGHVEGHVVYLHEWSSIHGSWSFADPESPINDYSWAIGYVEGGTQIQPFRSAGRINFGLNNNVTLVHNTSIYITVKATNAAGLRGVSYSDPVLVDLTPPDIKYVYDGKAADETASDNNFVVANWAVEDLESDIKVCQWAIGYKPSGNDLLPFTVVTTTTASVEFPYNVLLGHTIYTTLMCENNAGLTSVKSSNGLKISNQKPSATNAQAELVSIPATEFKPRDLYQGVTNGLRLKCFGFTDDIGIRAYNLTYTGKDEDEQITFPPAQDVLFLDFTKMSLSQQNYNVSVQAKNVLNKRSDALVSTATIDTTVPSVDSSKSLSITWTNNIVEVSWDTIFISARPLFYEVSAGSVQAGVNIIQWQETNATSITFSIPPAVGSTTKLPVHVTVTSVSVSGFSAVKTGSFVLP